MATDLRKLILEYCAIEEIDQILRHSRELNETESIGLTARVFRRREILRELSARMRVPAEASNQRNPPHGD